MKRTFSIAILVVLIPIITLVVIIFTMNNRTYYSIGDRFPSPIVNQDNNPWLIVFIKPECNHCFNLLADLAMLSKENPSMRINLLAYSIATAKATKEYLSFYTFPLLLKHDKTGIAQELNIRTVPQGFLLDEKGIIRYRWKGQRSKQRMKELLTSFTKIGKIPIDQFSLEEKPVKFFSFDITRYTARDSALKQYVYELKQNIDIANEWYVTRRKNRTESVNKYLAHWKECDCEKDSTGYTYLSLVIDPLSGSLMEKQYAEGATLKEIDQLKRKMLIKSVW